jgi:cytoskeleton protein RodZ
MSIGTQLHQAREAQGLSLDQVAQATHIRLHYLEALESDQFELLPSVAQCRGFLRAYADYLKLNSNELIGVLEKDAKVSPVQFAPLHPGAETNEPLTSSDAIFKEVGSKLKTQRALMGLSLGDVERHTHIRMHYVEALESGDISHLPSPVQGRGMLSNYASFLGLDTETILLRFADGLQASLYDRQAARQATTPNPRHQDTGRIPARPSQLKRLFSMDFFVGGFLIIFLLVFSIWGALRISNLNSGKKPSPTAPPVSEVLLSTPENELTGIPTLIPGSAVAISPTLMVDTTFITGTVQANMTETPIVVGFTPGSISAPVQVYVVAKQRAWLRIIVDGNITFQGRVTPGSAYSFAGNNRIELLTGDGASLQVYYNQQDLGQLGSFGEVVERIFSIEGVQTATPAVQFTSTPAPTTTITPTPTPSPTGAIPSPSSTVNP